MVNGAQGIAVGMATSIPPHNINELCNAIVAVLDDPAITIEELIRSHIPGPDFPTGGTILGRNGIYRAYKTGRSLVTVRAKVHTEELREKEILVVDEIPYQVNKTQLIERIADLVQSDRVTGISNLRDESDRDAPVRIVIELKRGEDASLVLNQLYKHRVLQDTFSIIMIALVAGRPRTMPLKEMIEHYRDHRIEVIRRRTQFLLDEALARAHIVEGLLKALDLIDQIIALIKASADIPAAKTGLQERFEFTEIQADHIVKMTLGRLTGLEREKLQNEYAELLTKIADYRDILAREERVIAIIRQDLLDMKTRYGDERRTAISEEELDLDTEDLIAEENVVVTITREGYAKRLPISTYRAQGRGGRGVIGTEMKEGDFVEHLFVASTHDYVLCFTDQGKLYWLKVYNIPLLSRTARGRPMINMIPMAPEERITSFVPVRQFDERYLVMATKRGIIKRTALTEFKNVRQAGIIACTLEEGDTLVRVVLTTGEQDLLLGTRHAKSARFSEADVRKVGRQARGVIAMKLREDDELVDMVVVDDSARLLVACASGHGKRLDFSEFRTMNRNVQGIRLIGNMERNEAVVSMMAVLDDDQIVLTTREGQVVRTSVESVSIQGRDAGGVILIRLQEGDRLVAIAKVAKEDQNEEEEAEPPPAPEPREPAEPEPEVSGEEEAGEGEDIE